MCNDDIKILLSNLYERAGRAEAAHYRVAGRLQKRFYHVGAIAGAASVIVSASIFTTLQGEEWYMIRILTGILSVFAIVTKFLADFLNFGVRAEKHRLAAIDYSAIKREVEFKIWYSEMVTQEYLDELRIRWDKLNKECPTIDESVWNKLSRKDFSRHDAQVNLNGNNNV